MTRLLDDELREQLRALPRRERWDSLADVISASRLALDAVRRDLDEAEQWLLLEMREQEATTARTDHWLVNIEDRTKYGYDDEVLSELEGYLDPSEFAAAGETKTVTTWKKVQLNKLLKRGGVIASIINRGVQIIDKRSNVVLTHRLES